ncbi:hypothetical protein B0F90DRAFT_197534 [Multifurca ochricompacta]|uniref:Uncharacterized protein n=1 Tax=Multifurca ochricompacta TaxID=376703 RepID=A0AAD4QG44_9AGAM|nr:hypothetical protein B0F90DRAFT_197534 [Multifurca ochricompacta]
MNQTERKSYKIKIMGVMEGRGGCAREPSDKSDWIGRLLAKRGFPTRQAPETGAPEQGTEGHAHSTHTHTHTHTHTILTVTFRTSTNECSLAPWPLRACGWNGACAQKQSLWLWSSVRNRFNQTSRYPLHSNGLIYTPPIKTDGPYGSPYF